MRRLRVPDLGRLDIKAKKKKEDEARAWREILKYFSEEISRNELSYFRFMKFNVYFFFAKLQK